MKEKKKSTVVLDEKISEDAPILPKERSMHDIVTEVLESVGVGSPSDTKSSS